MPSPLQNPNHVGAYLHNASLHLYRVGNTPVPTKHTLQTIGNPFGTAVAGMSLPLTSDPPPFYSIPVPI